MQPYVTEAAAKKEEIQKLLSDVRSNQNLKPRAPAYVSRPFSLQRSFSGHALPLYAGYRLWLYVRVCTHTPYAHRTNLLWKLCFHDLCLPIPFLCPGRPAFVRFVLDRYPAGPSPSVFTEAGAAWKALSESEKQPYIDDYARAVAEHLLDLQGTPPTTAHSPACPHASQPNQPRSPFYTSAAATVV